MTMTTLQEIVDLADDMQIRGKERKAFIVEKREIEREKPNYKLKKEKEKLDYRLKREQPDYRLEREKEKPDYKLKRMRMRNRPD